MKLRSRQPARTIGHTTPTSPEGSPCAEDGSSVEGGVSSKQIGFRPFGRGAAEEESSRHGNVARVDGDRAGDPGGNREPVDHLAKVI
jgi:hypothetical protein